MNIFNNKNEDSVLNTINSIVNKNILEEGGGGQKAPDTNPAFKRKKEGEVESKSESESDVVKALQDAEADQGFGVWSAVSPTSLGSSYRKPLEDNKAAFDANKELNKGKSPGQQASEAQARSIAADPIGYNPTIIEDPEKRLTPRHQFDLDTRFPVAFPTSPTIPVINPIGNVMNNLFKKMYPTAQQLSLNANRRAQQSIANIQPTNRFIMAEAVISSPLKSSILTAQPSSVNVTKQENTSSTTNSTAKNKKVTAIGNSNTAIGNPDYTLSNNGNLASAESQLPKGAASTRQPIYPGNEEQVSNEIPRDEVVPAPVAPVAAAPVAAAPVAAAPVAPATSNRQPIQPGNKKEIDNQLSVDQVVAPIINTTNTRPGSVENTGASIVNKQNPVGTPNASGSAIKTPFVSKPEINTPATNPGFMTSPQGAPPPEPPRRSSQTGDFKVNPQVNTPATNPGFILSPQGAPKIPAPATPAPATPAPATPAPATPAPVKTDDDIPADIVRMQRQNRLDKLRNDARSDAKDQRIRAGEINTRGRAPRNEQYQFNINESLKDQLLNSLTTKKLKINSFGNRSSNSSSLNNPYQAQHQDIFAGSGRPADTASTSDQENNPNFVGPPSSLADPEKQSGFVGPPSSLMNKSVAPIVAKKPSPVIDTINSIMKDITAPIGTPNTSGTPIRTPSQKTSSSKPSQNVADTGIAQNQNDLVKLRAMGKQRTPNENGNDRFGNTPASQKLAQSQFDAWELSHANNPLVIAKKQSEVVSEPKRMSASDIVGGAAAAGADYRDNRTAPEGYDNKRGMTRADFNTKRDAAEEAAYPGSTKGRPARGGGSNVGLSSMMENNKELSTIKTILSEAPGTAYGYTPPPGLDKNGNPVSSTTSAPKSRLKANRDFTSMYLNMPAIEVARLGLGQMGSLVGPDLDKARFKFFREKLSTPLDLAKRIGNSTGIIDRLGLGDYTKFATSAGGQMSSIEDIADAEMDRAANFQNQLQNDFRTPTYTTQTRSSRTAELQAAREKMSGLTGS